MYLTQETNCLLNTIDSKEQIKGEQSLKASITWKKNTAFRATTGTGHSTWMDGPAEKGGENKGARPMEMLLVGIGGCSSYDVTQMLQKSRQKVEDCTCEITAERADAVPAVFTAIHLHFVIAGENLDEKKIARAVSLSAEKYCSASIMMQAAGAKVTHSFECHAAAVTDSQPRPSGLQGLHHMALFVPNLEDCVQFYSTTIGMDIEWQPDEDNVYLTSGADNLALHRATGPQAPASEQKLDHIGFVIEQVEQVQEWFDYLKAQGATLKNEPKTHRDGATSFYGADPAGNLVQFIHHPPISKG